MTYELHPRSFAEFERVKAIVLSNSQTVVDKFLRQEKFAFLGQSVSLGDASGKKRYCTVEGLEQQIRDFQGPVGLLYYLDESCLGLSKTGIMTKLVEK